MTAETPDVQTVFIEALSRESAADRAKYLDKVCKNTPELRERVEALLRAHTEAGGFFGGQDAVTDAQVISEKPGSQIGPYKLLQQLGEGGMGVVHMAEQEKPVRRMVALKIIKLGMDSSQVIARFEAERQALAMMDHHHIAKVLDAGKTETGRPYFAMELVKGVPITEYCDKNKLTPRERLEMFIPVCQAIQHAHQKGIIHRDIKPSNVLVTLYDGRPVPKVIDFGIAKATQQKLTENTMFTGIGQILGTLEYMSPEQAEMNQLDVDTRTDVYSLGVMLYELLTGSTPITKEKLRSTGLEEMLRAIRETEPPKPSTRLSDSGEAMPSISAVRKTEPAKLSKLVRGDLDWIVMKALEKDRTRRYETANGLAGDVERFLDDEAVTATPPSASYKFRKFARRNKATIITGTTIAAILLAATITSSSLAVWAMRAQKKANESAAQAVASAAAASKARVKAENNEAIAKKGAAKSKEVATFLKDMLQGVGPSVALGRDTKMLEEILNKTATRLDEGLQDHPEVRAELRTTIGTVYQQLSRRDAARDMFHRALESSKQLHGDHPLVVESLTRLAKTDGIDTPKNRLMLEEALAMSERMYGADAQEHAAALSSIASYYNRRALCPNAEPYWRESMAIHQRFGDTARVVSVQMGLAACVEGQGRWEEAADILRDVQRALPNLQGEAYRERGARCKTLLGRIRKEQNRYAEAEEYMEAALEYYESLSQPGLEYQFAIRNLVDLLREQSRFEEARHWQRKLVKQTLNIYGRESGYTSNAYINLGLVEADLENWDVARQSLQEGLQIRDGIMPEGDGWTRIAKEALEKVESRKTEDATSD